MLADAFPLAASQRGSAPDLTPVKSVGMDNIRGKTIVITGAARGIGYATAQALLARGARVVIGDRDIDALESAVAGISSLGQVSGHPLDVTDRESFVAFLDKARADGGGHIDVLINNAGVMPVGPFLDQSAQAIRSSIEVNFYGVLSGCQLVLPDMVKRRDGHIINIASLAGMVRCRPSRLRRNQIRGRRAVHRAGRRVRAARRQGHRGAPDVHQHRADLGDGAVFGPEAGQPSEIAAAIVKVLDKPKSRVSVPAWGKSFAVLATLLSDRAVAGSTRGWATTRCSSTSTALLAAVTKTARNTRRASSNTRTDQRPRGAYMITPTPAIHIAAPRMSHRSGLNPSNAIPHANDPATNTPP